MCLYCPAYGEISILFPSENQMCMFCLMFFHSQLLSFVSLDCICVSDCSLDYVLPQLHHISVVFCLNRWWDVRVKGKAQRLCFATVISFNARLTHGCDGGIKIFLSSHRQCLHSINAKIFSSDMVCLRNCAPADKTRTRGQQRSLKKKNLRRNLLTSVARLPWSTLRALNFLWGAAVVLVSQVCVMGIYFIWSCPLWLRLWWPAVRWSHGGLLAPNLIKLLTDPQG